MSSYATTDDVITLGRALTSEELEKAEKLLAVTSAVIRGRAARLGKDFDEMLKDDSDLQNIAKEVTVRAVLRALNTPSSSEPASQITVSALGYSHSYAPLVPGGGVFIRRSEWQMLGLSRQQVRNLEVI